MTIRVEMRPVARGDWPDGLVEVVLGATPSGTPTANAYGCVFRDDQPILRFRVYESQNGILEVAVPWLDRFVLIGIGFMFGWIDLAAMTYRWIAAPSYAMAIHVTDSNAILVGGTGIALFDSQMQERWTRSDLALDGIVIHRIDEREGIIEGEAEWDPPGGWRPFSIRMSTGADVHGGPRSG